MAGNTSKQPSVDAQHLKHLVGSIGLYIATKRLLPIGVRVNNIKSGIETQRKGDK